jgi:hypothetical protein
METLVFGCRQGRLRKVTFRVTSRWQNPKTLVNGRKNLKKLAAFNDLISWRLSKFPRIFADCLPDSHSLRQF